jgi:sterol desaturase/sphingolipid hydroxylase (fatty acid hydroxylase superfamily)
MDWLAGSRLHLVDVAVTRGLTYVPIYIFGFADAPLFAYVTFVSLQATFIHANIRFEFGPLRWFLATPQFHHWHHGADTTALDKNFAVHLPVLDWIFGTYYLPKGRWPESYGLNSGHAPPTGYLRQFLYPLMQRRKHESAVKSDN